MQNSAVVQEYQEYLKSVGTLQGFSEEELVQGRAPAGGTTGHLLFSS